MNNRIATLLFLCLFFFFSLTSYSCDCPQIDINDSAISWAKKAFLQHNEKVYAWDSMNHLMSHDSWVRKPDFPDCVFKMIYSTDLNQRRVGIYFLPYIFKTEKTLQSRISQTLVEFSNKQESPLSLISINILLKNPQIPIEGKLRCFPDNRCDRLLKNLIQARRSIGKSGPLPKDSPFRDIVEQLKEMESNDLSDWGKISIIGDLREDIFRSASLIQIGDAFFKCRNLAFAKELYELVANNGPDFYHEDYSMAQSRLKNYFRNH